MTAIALYPSTVSFHDLAISSGVIASIGQDVSRRSGQAFKGWANLVHVGFVGGGDVSTKRDFVSSVTYQMDFVSVPPLYSSIAALFATGLRVGISPPIRRPSFDVAGVDSYHVADVRHQFPQVGGYNRHYLSYDVSVLEAGNKPTNGVFGWSAADNVSQCGVIIDETETSGDRGTIEDECSQIGPEQNFGAITGTASRSFQCLEHVSRKRSENRFQPFNDAKIGVAQGSPLGAGCPLSPAKFGRAPLLVYTNSISLKGLTCQYQWYILSVTANWSYCWNNPQNLSVKLPWKDTVAAAATNGSNAAQTSLGYAQNVRAQIGIDRSWCARRTQVNQWYNVDNPLQQRSGRRVVWSPGWDSNPHGLGQGGDSTLRLPFRHQGTGYRKRRIGICLQAFPMRRVCLPYRHSFMHRSYVLMDDNPPSIEPSAHPLDIPSFNFPAEGSSDQLADRQWVSVGKQSGSDAVPNRVEPDHALSRNNLTDYIRDGASFSSARAPLAGSIILDYGYRKWILGVSGLLFKQRLSMGNQGLEMLKAECNASNFRIILSNAVLKLLIESHHASLREMGYTNNTIIAMVTAMGREAGLSDG